MVRVQYVTLMTVLFCSLVSSASAQDSTVWVQRYNGSGGLHDYAKNITIDNTSAVIVVGKTWSSQGNYDLLTIKYSSDGILQWSKSYDGGTGTDDSAVSVSVSLQGEIFVGGISQSSSGNMDYLLIKYSPNGDTLWTRRYDAGNHDQLAEIATDIFGNIFVTGSSVGGSGYDYTTIKYSSAGSLLWVNRYNGYGGLHDYARALHVDREGNVYVTGTSWRRRNFNNIQSIGTVKYSNNGTLQWAVHRSEYKPCEGLDVTSDNSGNVYVTGYEWSFSGYKATNFVTLKYNSTGAGIWTRLYNGPSSNYDYGRAIAVDGNGNVYVTGESYAAGSGYDIMTIMYDPAGTIVGSHRYDGPISDNDYARDIIYVGPDSVMVVGTSPGNGSSSDIVSILYDNQCNVYDTWPRRYNGAANLADRGVAAIADGSGIYVTGTSDGGATYFDLVTMKYSVSPSLTPTLPVITNVIDPGTGTDLIVKWMQGDRTNVTGYQVYFGDTTGNYIFGSVLIPENGSSEYSFTLSGLQRHTPTYVAVRSYNATDTLWSSYATTLPDTANYATIPIVMVYGWHGSTSTWSQMDIWLRNDHFNNRWIADNINSCGGSNEVGFDVNSNALSNFIETKRNELESTNGIRPVRIDILAHSMGGMVSRRYAASNDLWSANARGVTVERLIMLGTPNGGVPIAAIHKLTQKKNCWIHAVPCLLNAISEAVCAGPASDEFSPENVKLFNEDTNLSWYRNNVRYVGIAGTQNPGGYCRILGCPNDGFVSAASVVSAIPLESSIVYNDTAFSPYCNLGGCVILHLELPRHRVIYDNYVLPEIDGTIPVFQMSTVSSHSSVNEAISLSVDYNYSTMGLIHPYETVSETLQVWSSSSLDLIGDSYGDSISFSLVSPSLVIYDSTYLEPDSSGFFSRSMEMFVYSIPSPEPGEWIINVTAGQLADTIWPYFIVAGIGDGIELQPTISSSDVIQRDTATMSVSLLQNGSPLVGATVSVEGYSNSADQVLNSIMLDDGTGADNVAGDGIYTYQWVPINAFGTVSLLFKATGMPGPFSRESTSSIAVSACCIGSTGNIDGDPADIVDITDLTVLIDHLFINFPPLACPAEGNVDGDPANVVDITDLTALIDHLFINFPATAMCP